MAVSGTPRICKCNSNARCSKAPEHKKPAQDNATCANPRVNFLCREAKISNPSKMKRQMYARETIKKVCTQKRGKEK